jgi:hypothetical protein
MTEAQSGKAVVRVDDAGLLAVIDRVSKGAGTSFFDTCRPVLEQIRGDAMAKWPVRTGRSKKAFVIRETVRPDSLESALINTATNAWGNYAYKIRYSIWTAADLKAKVEEAAARAKSGAAATRIRDRMTLGLRRLHGEGAPDEASTGKAPWILWVRGPQKKATKKIVPKLQADLLRLGRF